MRERQRYEHKRHAVSLGRRTVYRPYRITTMVHTAQLEPDASRDGVETIGGQVGGALDLRKAVRKVPLEGLRLLEIGGEWGGG